MSKAPAVGVESRGVKRIVGLRIEGTCYSMKNSKGYSRNGGTFKNPKALRFEQDFMLQVKPHQKLGLGSLEQPLRVTVRIYYPSYRQDADAELIFDLLQHAGVIANDRYIREKHIYAYIDKANPCCHIVVEEI